MESQSETTNTLKQRNVGPIYLSDTHKVILVQYEYSMSKLDNIHMTTIKNLKHVSCRNDLSSLTFPSKRDRFRFDISAITVSLIGRVMEPT
jgi:hypothetical protein